MFHSTVAAVETTGVVAAVIVVMVVAVEEVDL